MAKSTYTMSRDSSLLYQYKDGRCIRSRSYWGIWGWTTNEVRFADELDIPDTFVLMLDGGELLDDIT